MNCDHARVLLLTAEPAELHPAHPSLLGRHLAHCDRCARLAAAIVAADASLHAALGTLAAAPVARAVPRRRAWRRSAALLPLAAAAALVLLLRRADAPRPPAGMSEQVPRHTVVNGTGASGVAVMQTRDPNITVVWNF